MVALVAAATQAAASSPESEATVPGIAVYAAAYFAAQHPTTAYDMLQHVPGFTFKNGADVRGFADAAANVIVDGARPATKDDSLSDILKRIPAGQVLRIEVIRGGVPGMDMHGRTVIANVVRHKIQHWNGKFTANASRGGDGRGYGTVEVDASRKVGSLVMEGSLQAGRLSSDGSGAGTWTRTDGEGHVLFSARERQRDYELRDKITGSLEGAVFGGEAKANGSYAIDTYHWRIDDQLPTVQGQSVEHYGQGSGTRELGVRFERPFGARMNLELYALDKHGPASQTDAFADQAGAAKLSGSPSTSYFATHKHASEDVVGASVKDQPEKTLSVQVGGEFAYNGVRTDTDYEEDAASVPLPAAHVRVAEARWEQYATAIWSASEKLAIDGTLKYEASRIHSAGDVRYENNLRYFKPRLQLTYELNDDDEVQWRLEREVGQLNFDNYVAQSASPVTGTVRVGNPSLRPEQDRVAEITMDHRFWKTGDITATLTQTWRGDTLDRIPIAGSEGTYDAPGNIGDATIQAFNLTFSLPTDPLGIQHCQLNGSLTLRHSHVIDPTTRTARPLTDMLKDQWNLSFIHSVPNWRASWGFDVSGQATARAYRFDEIDDVNGIISLTLHAEYKASADLLLQAYLSNTALRPTVNSREVWPGVRSAGPPDFTDTYSIQTGRMIALKAVKSF